MICRYCGERVEGEYWEHLAFDPPRGCVQISVAFGKFWPWKDGSERGGLGKADSKNKWADRNKLILDAFFTKRQTADKIAREFRLTKAGILEIIRESGLKICMGCRMKPTVKGKYHCSECQKTKRPGRPKKT